MAFQQPQPRPQPPRPLSLPAEPVAHPLPASPTRKRPLDDSQEWILFSPAPADQQSQSRSRASPTARTNTATTTTYRSDFGSLETRVRSQPQGHNAVQQDPTTTEWGAEDVDVVNDDDNDNAELDSLDDGLHAFHHPFSASSSHPLDQSGGAVLPTHDGLGTFFPSDSGLQEHLWQFEKHNPHRRRHAPRRSSIQVQIDEAAAEDRETGQEEERVARIEKWRLEQSRAVLDEIERETRRRRRRMSRLSGASGSTDVRMETRQDGSVARTLPRVDSVTNAQSSDHNIEQPQDRPDQPPESFWRRITRRVIQDLIGLDDTTLSVIFGEQLPDDSAFSPTPTQRSPLAQAARREESSRVSFRDGGASSGWEVKLLERIARELGVLLHHLAAEHEHGRAFSTYPREREGEVEEAQYAAGAQPWQQSHSVFRQAPRIRPTTRHRHIPARTLSDPLFSPTLLPQQDAIDTSLWGIEEEPSFTPNDPADTTGQEHEYWERDIDVRMTFSYLRRRFSSLSTPTMLNPHPATASSAAQTSVAATGAGGPLPASWATNPTAATATSTSVFPGTSPSSQQRAELIRRQHPLVSRAAAAQARRRDALLLRRTQMQSLILMKRVGTGGGSSSCASQSTNKRSRRTRSVSERAFWDFPAGPAGSGGGEGGLGGWGEV